MGYTLRSPYDEIHDDFLASRRPHLSAQGFCKLGDITRRILFWFEAEELLPEELSITDATRFLAAMAERTNRSGVSVSAGTVCNYLKVARALFSWLLSLERVRSNPFCALEYPRLGEHLSRNVLTEAQMARLLSSLARFDEADHLLVRQRRYRVHVLCEFLYATGLRIAEAASLVPANLDLPHRLVHLPQGKGGAPRTAFLSSYAADVMARYLAQGREAVLGRYPRSHGDTVFGADKARLAFLVNTELSRVCTALGIPVITTHGFRHSLGTHLLRSGCDMRHIQAILGHEALGSTQIYTRVDKDDLKRSLDAFHPRTWSPRDVQEASS